MSIKQAIEALESAAQYLTGNYPRSVKTDAQVASGINAALAALRSMPQGEPVVYAARYKDGPESGMCVISLHAKKEDAQAAADAHKEKTRKEWIEGGEFLKAECPELNLSDREWSDEHGTGFDYWDVCEQIVYPPGQFPCAECEGTGQVFGSQHSESCPKCSVSDPDFQFESGIPLATPHTAPVPLIESDCRVLYEANKYASGIDFIRAIERAVLGRGGKD